MHRDHQDWQSENALWRDQLREWERQTAQATADLELIHAALAKHEESLQRHAAAVRLYEQKSLEHEHRMAAAAAAPGTSAPGDVAHGEEIADHHQVRLRHEALKRRHHELMARLSLLIQSLRAEP